MQSRKKDNKIHYLYHSLTKRHICKNVTAETASYTYHLNFSKFAIFAEAVIIIYTTVKYNLHKLSNDKLK